MQSEESRSSEVTNCLENIDYRWKMNNLPTRNVKSICNMKNPTLVFRPSALVLIKNKIL